MELSQVLEIVEKENKQMSFGKLPLYMNSEDLPYLSFEHEGIQCCIVRPKAGHLCGYIKLQSTNLPEYDYGTADERYDAFYGVTYVSDGWIGFDCAHLNQLSPYSAKLMQDSGYSFDVSDEEYITLETVIEKTKALAEQERKIVDSSTSTD